MSQQAAGTPPGSPHRLPRAAHLAADVRAGAVVNDRAARHAIFRGIRAADFHTTYADATLDLQTRIDAEFDKAEIKRNKQLAQEAEAAADRAEREAVLAKKRAKSDKLNAKLAELGLVVVKARQRPRRSDDPIDPNTLDDADADPVAEFTQKVADGEKGFTEAALKVFEKAVADFEADGYEVISHARATREARHAYTQTELDRAFASDDEKAPVDLNDLGSATPKQLAALAKQVAEAQKGKRKAAGLTEKDKPIKARKTDPKQTATTAAAANAAAAPAPRSEGSIQAEALRRSTGYRTDINEARAKVGKAALDPVQVGELHAEVVAKVRRNDRGERGFNFTNLDPLVRTYISKP